MQKNHAEIMPADEPHLNIVFSYQSLRSDFLLKYTEESPFFQNPLFVIFDQKYVSKDSLVGLFTRNLHNPALFFNSAIYFKNLFYLNFLTLNSISHVNYFSQTPPSLFMSSALGQLRPDSRHPQNLLSESFYLSNVLDKRVGSFFTDNCIADDLFFSSPAGNNLTESFLSELPTKTQEALAVYDNLGLNSNPLFSTDSLKLDTVSFLKQARWLSNYSPISKSDVSFLTSLGGLEKSGLSFKNNKLSVIDSFEWQSFRNVLLSQISSVDYSETLVTLKETTDYKPLSSLTSSYYAVNLLNFFGYNANKRALPPLFNSELTSLGYVLTSSTISDKYFSARPGSLFFVEIRSDQPTETTLGLRLRRLM